MPITVPPAIGILILKMHRNKFTKSFELCKKEKHPSNSRILI